MSYTYYQQFTDDEDLFPVLDQEEEFECNDEEQEEEQVCCARGCSYCLGVE